MRQQIPQKGRTINYYAPFQVPGSKRVLPVNILFMRVIVFTNVNQSLFHETSSDGMSGLERYEEACP